MLTAKEKEARRSGIGGSDMAAVFDKSPWMTRYELWESKALRKDPVLTEEQEVFLGTRSRAEDFIANEFIERHGYKFVNPRKTFRDIKKYPWLLANVDRLLPSHDAVVEIKSQSPYKRSDWGEPGTAEVPMHYLLQGATYCLVLDKPRCIFLVAFGFDEYIDFVYERNKALKSEIVQKSRAFWFNHVKPVDVDGNELPPVAPPPTTKDDLNRLYKAVEGTRIEATLPICEKFDRYVEVSGELKALQSEKDQLAKELKLFMGNSELLCYKEDVLMRLQTVSRSSVPVKMLKDAYPRIYENLLQVSTYNKLTIKGN